MASEHKMFPDYFVTPDTLRRRLRYLERFHKIASLDQVIHQLATGDIAPRQVVLTFDDGTYGILTHALPILEQQRAPATMYVLSAALEGPTTALSMAVRELFLVTKQQKARGELFADQQPRPLTTIHNRLECGQLCVRKMNTSYEDDASRLAFAQATCVTLGLEWQRLFGDRHWDYMVASEVRACADAGIDIQLHSHRHQTTVELGPRLTSDTSECRTLVERVTGRAATDYCYPSGLWTRSCWPMLREAGVRSAVTCKVGPNFATSHPLSLRRYIDGESMPQIEFEAMVSGFKWHVARMLNRADRDHPTEAVDESSPYY